MKPDEETLGNLCDAITLITHGIDQIERAGNLIVKVVARVIQTPGLLGQEIPPRPQNPEGG